MKNTKTIIAIIAFAAAFVFAAGLVRLINPAPVTEYIYVNRPVYVERRATNDIEEFIQRDESNGDNRDVADSGKADSVMNYWQTSSNMDASRFPQDFQIAWRNHMQAWHNYADYLQNVKKSKQVYSAEADRRYDAEISRTWEIVLESGRSHGAEVW